MPLSQLCRMACLTAFMVGGAVLALFGASPDQLRLKPTFDCNELKSYSELTNSIWTIRQRLDATEKAAGSNNTNVANLLSDLAGAYDDMGDCAQALRLDERCLSIRQALLGSDREEVADVLHDMAWEYQGMGDYEQALQLYRRSLAITEKRLDPQDPEVAITLNNMADAYREMGDYTQALVLCQRALAIRQKANGQEHPDIADSLSSLARIFKCIGKQREARQACERGLAIAEKALEPEHPVVADSLAVKGAVFADLGEYSEAWSAYQRALAIYTKISGSDHPDAMDVLEGMSVLSARRLDLEQGLALAVELCLRQRRYLVGQTLALRDTDALRIIRRSFQAEEIIQSICQETTGERSRRSAHAGAQALALSKAFLEEVRAAHAAFEANPGTGTLALRERYRAIQVQLERLAKGERDSGRRETMRSELQSQLSQIEQQLSERSLVLAQTIRDRDLTLEQIARGLPRGGALADFVQYRRFDFSAQGTNQWKEQRYAVYLTLALANDSTNVLTERIDLGATTPIDDAIEAICERVSAGQFAAKDLRLALRRLSVQVFEPLAACLTNVSHLIICPDGQLSRLPFEMLSHEGRFLIEEKIISYVGSGREIARLAVRPRSIGRGSAPIVMGNPDFDLDLSAIATGSRAQQGETAGLPLEPMEVGATRTLSRDYRGGKFKPLPGAEVEARSVAKLLGEDTVLKVGADAREADLKMVASPKVLHLATHGFFLSDKELEPTHSPNSNLVPSGGFASREVDWENPLVRCGIALAGANHASQVMSGNIEDGLFTGLEASLLNLQGTELVILSACDSGAGEVRAGEGVMSLRRAFRIAGAEAVLASHWKVNDQATRRLVTEFIRRWRSGEPRAEAWRGSQLLLLRSEEFANPYFWAAFTLTGDWR